MFGPGAKPPAPGAKPLGKPPAPGAKPAPAGADGSMMRKLDDKDIDKIFKKLGVKDEELSAGAVSPSEAAAPVPPAPPLPPNMMAKPLPPGAKPGVMPAKPVPPVPQMPGMPSAPPPPPLPGAKPLAPPAKPGGMISGAVPPQKPALPQAPMAKPVTAIPPVPKPAAAAAAPKPKSSGLLGEVDDAAMDKLFDKLGMKDTSQPAQPAAQPPKVNVREAVNTVRDIAVKTGTIPKPQPRQIDGISRLSASADSRDQEGGAGKIQIAKFLLDQQDQQLLGKLTQHDLAESKVRVLTLEAADEIYKLLNHISTLPGVLGSCIVGHDGMPIANNLPQELDPEIIGALSLGIYVNTTNTIRRMSHNHLHQLVARTQFGFLIVADFGGGILITVSNAQQTEQLIPLMKSITQLVAQ